MAATFKRRIVFRRSKLRLVVDVRILVLVISGVHGQDCLSLAIFVFGLCIRQNFYDVYLVVLELKRLTYFPSQ